MIERILTARALAGSAHVDCLSFRWLSAVRAGGATVHLVPRIEVGTPGPSLCGEVAPFTDRGTQRWRRVARGGGKVCNACHAESTSEPSRIDWS